MVEDWSNDGEGRTAGRTSGASSSHSGRSSSPSSHASDPEQPKLDMVESESGENQSPSTLQESAALRFFAVPELLSLVLRQFDYEKTELLVLSCVSKRMRANVLPRLVESLNVPFTKARDARIYLESAPGLASHVRYLRLWDDIGRHFWNQGPWYDQGPPERWTYSSSPFQPEDMWEQLRNLLSLLHTNTKARHGQMPLIDLSIGLSNVGSLHAHLQQNPILVERLVALRLMDDFCLWDLHDQATRYGTPVDQVDRMKHSICTLAQKNTNDLEDFIRMVCEAQDEAGSTTFRFFGITASAPDFDNVNCTRECFLPCLSQEVLVPLAKRIQHLSLVFGRVSYVDGSAYQSILTPDWPQLQSFDIRVNKKPYACPSDFKATTVSFCERHPTLIRINTDIYDLFDQHERTRPYWSKLSFAQLRACTLKIADSHANKTGLDFVSRHNGIQELSLAEGQVHADGRILASYEPLRNSLRLLRAGPYAIRHFLRKGTKLRHVQVMSDEDPLFVDDDTDDDEEDERDGEKYHCAIFRDARSYSSITYIDYVSSQVGIDILFDNIVRDLCLNQLPNLTELSLSITGNPGISLDGPRAYAFLLKGLFEKLQMCAKLRAVRVGSSCAEDLPSDDDELNAIVQVIPPRLEYLTWYVQLRPTAHHYRVVRTAGLDPTVVVENAPSLLDEESKLRTARLETLATSFWPKVDKRTGLWEDLDHERGCATRGCTPLFDHLGDDGPVLRYSLRTVQKSSDELDERG
ncbi:hypothetical protein A4X09_0g5109 [Tilletia walkeri]|uniref:Uncharacterized protein n=1 Tax=Tilletia walkeri TaxID=117179 RepID=A0A8X7T3Y1_9BASI|nr:hypothetical protein A4X09_0g5109 [Tilletia walkeri]